MQINRVYVSQETTDRLKLLKGRTGLKNNILCRLGFCFSLNEQSIPNPADYPEDGLEFNRFTLLGDHDELYIAMLKQRVAEDGLTCDELQDQFRAHTNRGVVALSKLVKGVADIPKLATRR